MPDQDQQQSQDSGEGWFTDLVDHTIDNPYGNMYAEMRGYNDSDVTKFQTHTITQNGEGMPVTIQDHDYDPLKNDGGLLNPFNQVAEADHLFRGLF
jgi:hypothetical protein